MACSPPPSQDGKIRLIIDLRRGNLYFGECKDPNLLNPAHLVEIIVEGDKVFFGKTDISIFPHMGRVPPAVILWVATGVDHQGVDGPPMWMWPVMSVSFGMLTSPSSMTPSSSQPFSTDALHP